MTEVLLFPDAVGTALTYLRANAGTFDDLDGVTFVNELPPAEKPGRVVRLRRVGGSPRNLVVDVPTLDFMVWDTDEEAAMATARQVRALLMAAPRRGGIVTFAGQATVISTVDEVTGPTLLPDPVNPDRDVVVMTFDVAMRGTSAQMP